MKVVMWGGEITFKILHPFKAHFFLVFLGSVIAALVLRSITEPAT